MSWHGYLFIPETMKSEVVSSTEYSNLPARKYHDLQINEWLLSECFFSDVTDYVPYKLDYDWLLGGQLGRLIANSTTYHVTTLSDSGPGSLREALASSGRRKVVFDISGTIELDSHLCISDPYCIVLGETAPNGGICIKNRSLLIESHDIYLRHLRTRPGASSGEALDAITINPPAYNVMIDHCSMSWAVDENLDIYGALGSDTMRNITIQNCIISEGLMHSVHPSGAHSMGVISAYATDITMRNNVFAHNNQRCPLVSGRVDFINNVVYGWGDYAGWVRYRESENIDTEVNFINNFYLPSAESNLNPNMGLIHVHDGALDDAKIGIYSYGNTYPEPWVSDRDIIRLNWQSHGPIEKYIKSEQHPLLRNNSILSRRNILDNAGATLPRRDSVDSRIISNITNTIGSIIDDPTEVGGWPTL